MPSSRRRIAVRYVRTGASMSVKNPTIDDLRGYSDKHDLKLSDADLGVYLGMMGPSLDVYRELDDVADMNRVADYPRGRARQPTADENPLNGWSTRIEIAGAPDGPLAGRTVVIKDNICVRGAPLYNGTRMLEDYIAESDATVVERVLTAGATIIGKAHCEYMCGSGGSHTSAWGHVRNPHDPSRSAGGSSSGCAALVANGEADLSIGCDQGGSVRMPASFSGIVGMKPSHGLVPYTGIVPIDPTIDHAGPMTATVTDNALLLSVLAGEDGLDPRQHGPRVGDYLGGIEDGVTGLRIGLVTEGFGQVGAEKDVDQCVRAAAESLRSLGAEVEDVSIPFHRSKGTVGGAPAWLPIAYEGVLRTFCYNHGFGTAGRGFYPLDLMDRMARYQDGTDEMPANIKMFMLLGEHMRTHHHGRYYAKAQNEVIRASKVFDDALSAFDILVMPTTPMKATPLPPADASIELILQRAFEPLTNTAIFDATGHPAMSMPCGKGEGLPIGLMMIGKHYDEATIYRAGRALEVQLDLDMTPS